MLYSINIFGTLHTDQKTNYDILIEGVIEGSSPFDALIKAMNELPIKNAFHQLWCIDENEYFDLNCDPVLINTVRRFARNHQFFNAHKKERAFYTSPVTLIFPLITLEDEEIDQMVKPLPVYDFMIATKQPFLPLGANYEPR